MNLTLTHNRNIWSVMFDAELEIKWARMNERKVKLTRYREDRIWNYFNDQFDLNEELHQHHYAQKEYEQREL